MKLCWLKEKHMSCESTHSNCRLQLAVLSVTAAARHLTRQSGTRS